MGHVSGIPVEIEVAAGVSGCDKGSLSGVGTTVDGGVIGTFDGILLLDHTNRAVDCRNC